MVCPLDFNVVRYLPIWPMPFRDISLVLGHPCNFLSGNDLTLTIRDKYSLWIRKNLLTIHSAINNDKAAKPGAYEEFGSISRYIRQGLITTSHRKLWDEITRQCLTYLLLAPNSSYLLEYTVHVGELTHWWRVTHICVNKLTIIGSDNGLSPGRRQVIIWTNAEILLIGPLGTNFSEISIEI